MAIESSEETTREDGFSTPAYPSPTGQTQSEDGTDPTFSASSSTQSPQNQTTFLALPTRDL